MNKPERSLFRMEALRQPAFGEAFSFAIPDWRKIALIPAGAALLLGTFSLFANFDRAAQARGVLMPVSGISRLLAPQSGIVSDVYVGQGHRIPKGAAVLKIASPERLPSGASAKTLALDALRRQQAMIVQSMAAERERQSAEQSQLGQQLAELAKAGESYRVQIALQMERIKKNEELLAKMRPLRAKGFVSENSYLAIEDTVLGQRQQLSILTRNLDAAQYELRRTRLRLSELVATGKREDLRSEASLFEIERDLAQAQVEAEVVVAAPTDGTVGAITVRPGMTVARGQEVASVMRSDDELEAVVFVPTNAVGSLRPGQSVVLHYDAFPFQRFGVGHGQVKDISQSAALLPGRGERVYWTRVRLLDAQRFALRSDMSLTAQIIVEERTLLDWILSPLREKMKERERKR